MPSYLCASPKGCIRRLSAKEVMYHPDRVNFPLKRAGERGEAKWERISWEQAFDEIAKKLQGIKDKYGAEALASVKGTFRNKNFQTRFLMLFGSPNSTTAGKICAGPLFAGFQCHVRVVRGPVQPPRRP